MKNFRLLMMVASIGFLFASCSNDPCIVGKWTILNAPSGCAGTVYEINSDGTGQTIEPDCNNACPDSDVHNRINFTWIYTEETGIIAINFLADGMQCEAPHTFPVGVISGNLVCNGYAATITTNPPVVYTYTLQRN